MVDEIGPPVGITEGFLLEFTDVTYSPTYPRANEPFTVTGKIELLKVPYLAPIWMIATVEYPERWWEEIIPIIGAKEVRATTTAWGGNFTIKFPEGFKREGDFKLSVRAYGGPTTPLDSLTLPPFPPVNTYETTFTVEGEVPEIKEGFDITEVTINGRSTTNKVTDYDFDYENPKPMSTDDSLAVTFKFRWTGLAQNVMVKVRAGHKGIIPSDFVEKTDYFTAALSLPEASELEPYEGSLETLVTVPLTGCGGISDGAVEIKIEGYISQIWNVYTTKEPGGGDFKFSAIIIDDNEVKTTDHDADSKLMLEKSTSDYLTIQPQFQWQGPERDAVISIKVGHKSLLLGFDPKTDAYTADITLPESLDTAFEGKLTNPIVVPLTECGGVSDGAVEVVLKITKMADYITHIWNVYTTELAGQADIEGNPTINVTHGVYGGGDSVPFTVDYKYRGPAQKGQYTIEIGTGSPPYFSTQYRYDPQPINFARSDDHQPGSISANMILPDTLVDGQTYSVKVILEALEYPTKEASDVDFNAFDFEVALTPGGKIVKKELDYDGEQKAIPVSSVPMGVSGQVHIWGRNDSSKATEIGISWIVRKADGQAVENYSDWAWGTKDPGETHEFIGGRFDLDKAGTYNLYVTLYVDKDNPKQVATYTGTLCTVQQAAGVSGQISKKVIEYNGYESNIPVYGIKLGLDAKVHVWGKNTSNTSQGMGISWIVRGPDGNAKQNYYDWAWGEKGPGETHEFIGPEFLLGLPTWYKITVILWMGEESQAVQVDSYDSYLCYVNPY